tara:strand:+ start:80 stop:490 length:411 start_codon:yes stop_codon:yes gene_type:complete
VRIKRICFSVNNLNKIKEIIHISRQNNIFPIIYIKYYLAKGFGLEWITSLDFILSKSFKKNSYELFVDANRDHGFTIELIKNRIKYIKIKCNPIIFDKITKIAKKNKVLLNPSFHIVDLSNIKNIKRKLSLIIAKG